jgi:protein TonB
LLGQTELYTYPVRLPGAIEPKLDIAWNSFHSNFLSGIPVFFRPVKIDRNAPPSEVFPDTNVPNRLPLIGFLLAALLHAAFFVIPWPNIPITPRVNHAFDDTQLTWSGPINDLPLLSIPKNKEKSAAKSDTPKPVSESADAYHPRQRINTDPVHPTHPRQTLINPSAPPDPPKLLPQMPNIVQVAAAVPARPHVEIDEKTLAKSRPKAVKTVSASDVPAPEISNLEQHTAMLNIAATPAGPAKPKLQINASSAPRAVGRSQVGENAAPPEVAMPATAGNASSATLIALSTTPGPPTPVVPMPQGNLAARVAISPEGKPGASGSSSGTSTGNGTSDAANSGGAGNGSVGVSISGGNPRPNSNMSGLGGAAKFTIPRTESAIRRPDPSTSIEDPERTGPPNFLSLPPGAKPEQIFSNRHVYSLNVNMPNLNSSTGNWIIHFSELHLADAAHRSAEVTSPIPIKKVDPKYPQDAILEHIEGEVILYGVIRRDGTVDSIQKVRGIDPVLDANSMQAFAQWKFQPATRDGVPVDLEAVVHIPFKAPERKY